MVSDQEDPDTIVILREDRDRPLNAILAIQEVMSGVEWNAGTLDEIAQILIGAGYIILDIDGVEQV